MKILMLGWELPPHNSGGLGVACLNMARALAKAGAEIDFVVPYAAEHPHTEFMKVLHATELDPIYRYGGGAYESMNVVEKIIPRKFETHEEMVSIRDVQKNYQEFVEEYLMDFKPDVVHAHDWLTYEAGVLAKKHYGIPLVAHVHATEFDRAGGQEGNPLIHEVEYEGLMMADKIIAVSEATRQIVSEKYAIPLDKIDVVYNSLDEDYCHENYHLDPRMYEYLCSLKAQGYTIVTTVGRFTIQKGMKQFLQAAALALSKNPKMIFVMAGDGELRNYLVRLAANLQISRNVLFTGFLRGRKLRDIYALSDIFVMSSSSEPFGLTALEAAHHSDALILTKQSGVAEVLWSCLTYDYWDTQRLADEMCAISLNPALKNSLQTNIKNEYRQISWDQVAKKCLRVYNRIMKHKRYQ